MNTGTTYGTAVLRGLYLFFCTALVAGITAYMGVGILVDGSVDVLVDERDRIVYAVLTGVLAGLGALGFRAGAEGVYDGLRDANVNAGNEAPKPSDVGQPNV